ncbi:hypothetical protein ACMU_09160 [Actibacterium mucosum KCTC 23349]|uniref:PepSY domain-containing protein n=1 Tax=Actibacterium mucosum KCTC 23349 TaxID=1454373 RepID=A0A037ZJY9_9RHOB|nr:hypothetical protein [Actibacterium mucosum]KAJ55924.1 hypothetical protein ACMU_09160 [Actibacterium mucosum KCTC 23349]
MTRHIAMLVLVSALCAPVVAGAQTPYVDRIVAQLLADGYADIEVSRTWLGRFLIEAERNGHERVIVVNARTGEVLRDVWQLDDDGRENGDDDDD